MTPRVSICIPTYRRPDGLRTAIQSILAAPDDVLRDVQLVVSDNSPDDACEALFHELVKDHPGPSHYHRNVPDVGMVGNHNRCIELATGDYVQILHDDDYFLPDGTSHLVDAARRHNDPALVFGVHVVDDTGRVIQKREHGETEHLTPREAVQRLLMHSSYVRFPAMVVRRDVYTELGGFEDGLGGAEDLEAWVRIASAHGLTLVDQNTAAYVVHRGADTESMFVRETIQHLDRVFDRAREAGILSEDEIRACQAGFLHRFILGGTWRALKSGSRGIARERLELLSLPEVRQHGRPWRWMPTAVAMRLLTSGARVPS